MRHIQHALAAYLGIAMSTGSLETAAELDTHIDGRRVRYPSDVVPKHNDPDLRAKYAAERIAKKKAAYAKRHTHD